MFAKLIIESGQIKFYSGFDRGLVQELSNKIPDGEKRPIYTNGKFSHWSILPKHQDALIDILNNTCGIKPRIIGNIQPETPHTRLLNLRYLGSTKDRGVSKTAYGHDGNDWAVEIPESVLIDWFNFGFRPSKPKTLYDVLGTNKNASDKEIKTAYRLMAKKYHPDKPTGNAQKFMSVQGAYEFLSNKKKRKLYNIGLLEDGKKKPRSYSKGGRNQYGYAPPIKCGHVLASGIDRLGLFYIDKIMKWEPIINNGKQLETSFDITNSEIVETWI